MGNSAFLTLHDKNYPEEFYLYHYTRFESASRILFYDSLRFSSIGKNLNDCTEYKNKIHFYKNSRLNDSIINFFSDTINKHIRICCFSEDDNLQERYSKQDDRYFTDHSGRGFCLPKMWSHYAADNKGVCFIINRAKLAAAIQKKNLYMKAAPISYVRQYPYFTFTEDMVESFVAQMVDDKKKTYEWIPDFFTQYPDCVLMNYFVKNRNWRDEHEFRFMVYTPYPEEIFSVDGLSSFLEGIVIGENFDEVDLKMLTALVPKDVPIKQVVFQQDKTILK